MKNYTHLLQFQSCLVKLKLETLPGNGKNNKYLKHSIFFVAHFHTCFTVQYEMIT